MAVMRTAPLRQHLWCQRTADLGSSGCQRSGREGCMTAILVIPTRPSASRRHQDGFLSASVLIK